MPLWNDRPESWHEVLPQVRRRILAHGPQVMLVLYEIGPSVTFPLHNHPHLQSGVVLEGGGDFRVGDETWKLTKGSAYVVPSGVSHELVTEPGGPTRILDVFVPEREDFVSEASPPDRP